VNAESVGPTSPAPNPPSCHRGIFTIDADLPAYMVPTTVTVVPLSGRLWTASDSVYRTIFLKGDRGVIAFDTFSTPAAARSYRSVIGRLWPGRELHSIVYSHDHIDHCGFAADLAGDANVIAHQEAADVIRARRSDGQTVPTETWSGPSRQLSIDGVDIELVNPGPTHGNGNIAAHLPQYKTIFMADTVMPGIGYNSFPDYHISTYLSSMRKLEALNWETFVPGHFWPMDRREFSESLDLHERLAELGQNALIDGVDADDLDEVAAWASEHTRDLFGDSFRYGEYMALNVMRYMVHFRTGGWGLEDNGGLVPTGGAAS
jgi:glyoxylase-like metal-dependent hydrolase (beta-lactamase superfamily II)